MGKSGMIIWCLAVGMIGSTALGEGRQFSPQLGLGMQVGSYSQDVLMHPDGSDSMDLMGIYLSLENAFTDWLAAEAKIGYNWGKENVSYRNPWGDERSSDLHLETVHIDISAKPFLTVQDSFQLYGKAGFSHMTRYVSGGGSLFTVTDSGFALLLGAGVGYTHSSGFGLHTEINHYLGDDADYTMVHIGGHKRF